MAWVSPQVTDAVPSLQGSEPSYLERLDQLHAVMCSTMEKVGGAGGGVGLGECWAGLIDEAIGKGQGPGLEGSIRREVGRGCLLGRRTPSFVRVSKSLPL